MSLDELRETYRDARYGAYKLLYVAPERLLTDGFCSLAQELLEVSGVGHVKAERYGAAFLNEIRQFEHTHREES